MWHLCKHIMRNTLYLALRLQPFASRLFGVGLRICLSAVKQMLLFLSLFCGEPFPLESSNTTSVLRVCALNIRLLRLS